MSQGFIQALATVWTFVVETLHHHFDKLLLTALFVYMTMLLLHMSHDLVDAADVSWAREQSNLIIGALLGLITGAVLRNGSRSSETTTTTETREKL